MGKITLTKTLAIGIAVLMAIGGVTSYAHPGHGNRSISFSIAPSMTVGIAGTPVSFTILPNVSGATVHAVHWNFGDGTTQTAKGATITHVYGNAGYYLVSATAKITHGADLVAFSLTSTNNLELFPFLVQPSLTLAQAPNASVPTINFLLSKNPKAPIFNVGETVYPIGGFLELPNNFFWAIQQYSWNFGNGNSQTVQSSSDNSLPSKNVTTSYSTPGLYPMSLILTTVDSTGAKFTVKVVHTAAVQSISMQFAVQTGKGGVINPRVITSAEVVPVGAFSFDPQIDYESQGFEVLQNIFQTLVIYNGSSTHSFIPYLAAALPTRQNGEISSDFKTYTFQIRDNQFFSNGDKVGAYDAWFSFARALAFTAGEPGTSDWILAQYLVPGVQNGTASVYVNNTWKVATTAITNNTALNRVTLHFNRPMSPSLVFQVLADPLFAGIVDSKYAISVGAGFNESTWDSYKNQANFGFYNVMMQWHPVSSGPYMVQSLALGQTVTLAPNPHYGGVLGIPKANTTVIIDWVKTHSTAFLMLQDAQADSAAGLPQTDIPAVQQLQGMGLANIFSFPTFDEFFYTFNININKAIEASQFGPGFNEPSNYFADLPTRLAWTDAFDYLNYLNNILGNAKYHETLGRGYQGIVPLGMIYSVPPNQLGGLPAQNLKDAEGNYSNSAWAGMSITVPIVVPSGDVTELLAATQWAAALATISGGNISAKVFEVSFFQEIGDQVPGFDPMGVYWLGWIPDYPDPSDYVDAMYGLGGPYPNGNNWLAQGSSNTFAYTNAGGFAPNTPGDVVNVANTGSNGPVSQDLAYKWLNGNLTIGDTSVDPAIRQKAYKTTELLAIDLGLYVYELNTEQLWFFRSWFGGHQFQENPMIGGQGDLVYFWLTK